MAQILNTVNESLRGVRLFAGASTIPIPDRIADAYREGDRLVVADGEVVHIPAVQAHIAQQAVTGAVRAFQQMANVPADNVTEFYETFAAALEDDQTWDTIASGNAEDVSAAHSLGRSTTRLVVSDKMRKEMVDGLREWRDAESPVGRVLETTAHEGWTVEDVVAPLGVVAFVFEGRPNVFADATGVLRSGNTAVLRIGGDALLTARAIVENALNPALSRAKLPENSVTLINSRERSAGSALFCDSRVALAVARGSGRATRQLGAIARQAGIPASLHGTGGAWMIVDDAAEPDRLGLAIRHSLDRKVCNTLNVICLLRSSVDRTWPIALAALRAAGEAGERGYRLHVVTGSRSCVDQGLFTEETTVVRASGAVTEPIATDMPEADLAREWEWEGTPEVSLVVVDDLPAGVALFNRYSPQFVLSVISANEAAQDFAFRLTNAPFVGDGFTRWVDGQFALCRPELGLSNWQNGRLLGRSGILSGDGIYTIRVRVRQQDPSVHR